jgi:hypothetical protein
MSWSTLKDPWIVEVLMSIPLCGLGILQGIETEPL